MTQAEFIDDRAIALEIGALEITQQAPAFADLHEQTASAGVVFLVRLEVLGEVVDRFGQQRGGGGACGACHPEMGNERDAERDIHDEGGGVDQRADALLTQHVQEALDRTDGGAGQEADELIRSGAAQEIYDRAGDWVAIETPEGSVRARARFNEGIDPRVVVGEHGWWQACAAIGAPGYDPFSPDGANINLILGVAALDPVSGTASHKSYVCEVRRTSA